MPTPLPPPPQRAEAGDFAWVAWYNQLYQMLSTQGSISWALIDKAGSSLNDLQNKDHAFTTNQLGGGSYHLSSTQYTRVTSFISQASDPGTGDIASGQWALYKNTSSGNIYLWANDGGVMKKVLLA